MLGSMLDESVFRSLVPAAPIAGKVGLPAVHGIKDDHCRMWATERGVGLCLELVGERENQFTVERARRARPSY